MNDVMVGISNRATHRLLVTSSLDDLQNQGLPADEVPTDCLLAVNNLSRIAAHQFGVKMSSIQSPEWQKTKMAALAQCFDELGLSLAEGTELAAQVASGLFN